jgi:hypothetical protein
MGGIFSKLFGSASGIEKTLEEQYVTIFEEMMGMPPAQARQTFRDLLAEAKQLSKAQGTFDLPTNFGDVLLEDESSDDEVKAMLYKKREEGVTNEDIKWWWNRHDLERAMMFKVDELHKLALFTKLIEEDGQPEKRAAHWVRKQHPYYGDPDDTTHTAGEDRPLPFELKDRINRYVIERQQKDPKEFKTDIDIRSSTFNALVRREIENGNL